MLEQQLGVLLNAKLDEYEESQGGDSDAESAQQHSRFRTEADAVMKQLVALKTYIADHAE